MKLDELIEALRRLKVETGSLACLGCGHEHNCSTQGCAILREAVEAVESLRLHESFLDCRFVKPGDPAFPIGAFAIPKFEERAFLKLGDTYFMPLFQVLDVIFEVTPENGHWVTEEEAIEKDDYSLRDTCSVCGHCDWDCTESKNFNFCPNCGAKMDDVYQPPICGPGEEDGDGFHNDL